MYKTTFDKTNMLTFITVEKAQCVTLEDVYTDRLSALLEADA